MSEMKVTSHKDEVIAAKNAAIMAALESIGITAEAHAKVACPVDTGNLRNSITHETGNSFVAIGTNVEYAPYVELGTSTQRAQPYLQPAIENYMDQYRQIIQQALK